MKLEIHKKSCNEIISLEIEPTAAIDDVLAMLYAQREGILDNVPFNVYQNVVAVHLVDLYSEHYITRLKSGTLLSDYKLNESSYITLDDYTHDQFLALLNQVHFHESEVSPVTRRTRSQFFTEQTAKDNQAERAAPPFYKAGC